MKIISDKDDGLVVKRLSKPRNKKTTVTANTKIESDDMSSLNSAPVNSKPRPAGRREASKKTLLGDEGFKEDGTFSWERNQDACQFLIQYHETYLGQYSEEYEVLEFDGQLKKTASRLVNIFNKTFSTKKQKYNLSTEELVSGLKYVFPTEEDSSPVAKPQVKGTTRSVAKPPEPEVDFVPLLNSQLTIENDRMPLYGEELEICKLLKCKAISVQMIYNGKGPIEKNGICSLVCGKSQKEKEKWMVESDCPKEQEFSPEEKSLYTGFMQYLKDKTAAKKMVIMTRNSYVEYDPPVVGDVGLVEAGESLSKDVETKKEPKKVSKKKNKTKN